MAYATPQLRWYPRMDRLLTVLWFDMDGNKLGNTEEKLNPEEFPLVQEGMASENGAGKRVTPVAEWGGIVPMADGLWVEAVCFVLDTDDDSADCVSIIGDNTTALVRIPEP